MASVPDPSFRASLLEPPSVNLKVYHLRVTHDDFPVQGATVCLRADMGGDGAMSGMGTSNVAHEVGPGTYQIDLTFPMGGPWRGRIVIQPPGGQAVATRWSSRLVRRRPTGR